MKTTQPYFKWFLALCIAVMPVLAAQASQPYGLPNFVKLAEENNQVVVNISTLKAPEQTRQRNIPPQFRGMPEEFMQHFFGFGFPHRFPQPDTPRDNDKKQVSSLGSGFIIGENGYILTNHHVIEGADEIIVRLRDRRELKAELIGSDERTDVAVLKIDADNLPTAKIGTSSDLKVGQWVMAIGEPFGLDYTVTHGIVSALGRSLPDDTYVPFIQTDVSINPGNSGGPLFNLDGQVVGINSQIYSKSGGSMGLSFSIPIDIAMNVANQIKEEGQVTRGFLGVQVQEVTSELAESFGLKKPVGALVGQTYEDTPAEKYGIQAGDIILKFNGKVIEKSSDLPPVVGITPINKKVPVVVLRQGERKTIWVKLQAMDSDKKVASKSHSKEGKPSSKSVLGAEFQDLTKDERGELNLPYGVRAIEVERGAFASAGVQAGDILMTVDFKQITNVNVLRKLIKGSQKNRSLPIRVIRDGRSLFLPLVIEK